MTIVENLPAQTLDEATKLQIEACKTLGDLRDLAQRKRIEMPPEWNSYVDSITLSDLFEKIERRKHGCPRCGSDDIYTASDNCPDPPLLGCNECSYYWTPGGGEGFSTGPGGSWR